MRRFLGLLWASLLAASASGQIAGEGSPAVAPLPPVGAAQVMEEEGLHYFSAERMSPDPAVEPRPELPAMIPDSPQGNFGDTVLPDPVDFEASSSRPKPDPIVGFLGYRYEVSSTEWTIGNGDQFGKFSLAWDHYQEPGVNHGLGAGVQIHFLSGPVTTDMPARAYDFSLAYQHRDRLGPFGYDAAVSVMASSDFEGSAREGIRFPGHAVGFLCVTQSTELVLGVDYLDRGDVKLLPVAGLITIPHRDLRLELVFPRPRVVLRLTDQHQLYVGGELGGNTWAVERVTTADDLATYRDLRLCVGLQSIDKDGDGAAIEIGYLFDRRLEYSSGEGNLNLDDTAMIRVISTF
ncbi:MAG: hypothetical protein ACYC6Y_16035 [Thermoguttaceae bacterium]